MMENLTAQQVRDVIEGRGCTQIPVLYDLWIYPSVMEKEQAQVEAMLEKYPRDVQEVFLRFLDMYDAPEEDGDYRWAAAGGKHREGVGLDADVVIEDWEDAEEFFERFPSPDYPGLIPEFQKDGERYLLARWWYLYFERLWSLRGMENALTDFYLYPDEVHRLFGKLTDFYERAMERAGKELDADGFFASDDIGTQNSPFFSLEIFRDFFKPYYKRLCDKAHELGMHFWLHTCGNVELFLEDFIEIGLDVIHPIQKGTMDEKKIADVYGDRICILAGFDVQQAIPFGSPEEVRKEVRYLIDTFDRGRGRFMLTMGNGTTPDWKKESLETLYEETCAYGGRE